MPQNTARQTLPEYLARAQKEHESPRPDDTITTSNGCIDPRLLALSHDAAIEEEVAHASSSAANDVASLRNYVGSDDNFLMQLG
jgi:hypothetical protein